jgi:hypothetical protein
MAAAETTNPSASAKSVASARTVASIGWCEASSPVRRMDTATKSRPSRVAPIWDITEKKDVKGGAMADERPCADRSRSGRQAVARA